MNTKPKLSITFAPPMASLIQFLVKMLVFQICICTSSLLFQMLSEIGFSLPSDNELLLTIFAKYSAYFLNINYLDDQL